VDFWRHPHEYRHCSARDLPNAHIKIGKNCLISEFNVLCSQGGITIGDNVNTAPLVQMAAVKYVYNDPNVPIIRQGITAQGIVIEDEAWIGAGTIILDGVRVAKGAVAAAVTQDEPPHTIVGGVPAWVIRTVESSERPTWPIYT
jgi:acetyltransferase-like isoleucine patch superfamily enzyme